MSTETESPLRRTVASALAAVAGRWNGYNAKPDDVYTAMAAGLDDAGLLVSTETAADFEQQLSAARAAVSEQHDDLVHALGRDGSGLEWSDLIDVATTAMRTAEGLEAAASAASAAEVVRLTAELSDERELVAAMHAASVGCVREPLLGHVADVAETRAAYLAQQHRADELDVIAKRAETRGVELEQQLAARTFYLADYEGISDGPTLHSTLDAAKAWVERRCSDFEDPAWDWYEQDGVWQQWTSDPDTDRPTSRGAGSVLPLTVAGDGVVAEAQRLRQGFLETVRQAALLTEVRDSQRDEIRRLQTEQGELMQALGGGPYDEWDEVVHRARQLAGATAFVAPAADAVPDQGGAE